MTPPIFSPQLISQYGDSIKYATLEILFKTGGAGDIQRGKSAPVFTSKAYLVGIILNGTMSLNVLGQSKVMAVGLDVGPGPFSFNGASFLFLTLAHTLGAASTPNIPVSKGAAIFFNIPFLPTIPQGGSVAGYISDNFAAGESAQGVITYYYIYDSVLTQILSGKSPVSPYAPGPVKSPYA